MSEVLLEPMEEPKGSAGVVERRVRDLLEQYVRLAGAGLEEVGPGLLRLTLPATEAHAFGGRTKHLLALDIDAAQAHPEAELPVTGSVFLERLVAALRRHGGRRVAGPLPITVCDDAAAPDVPVVDATVERSEQTRELRRCIRVTAKVSIAAGAALHEEVVVGDPIDVATGLELPEDVAAQMDAPETDEHPDERPASVSGADRLAPALIAGLEAKVAPRVEALNAQAERELKAELARIDRYYAAVKTEVLAASGPGSAAVQTVEREHEKRRTEETRRHEVRIDVVPLQVLERAVLVERATWQLVTATGRTAALNAERFLTGKGAWGIRCPGCRGQPEHLTVCRAGHAIGVECTLLCSVCNERFCTEHGHSSCAIDGAPVCSEDGSECWSCDRVHCSAHQAVCSDGGHTACVECIAACGSCGRGVCRKHAVATVDSAPRGERLLCTQCVVYCEGGRSEPVGRDEAEQCGTCGTWICEQHQVRCVADGQPHCSKHIRRADLSRRFICNEHVAACGHEATEVVFATDEVHTCVECGLAGCERHAAACHGDGRWHCWSHLAVLNDLPDAAACAQHRTTCHIDGRTFSIEGTAPCDVCSGATCRTHAHSCEWCGGRCCTKDIQNGRCTTCRSLAPVEDLPDDVIAALARATPGTRGKQRFSARDASRFIVQIDLGWTRHLVVTVPHSGARPRVLRHSMFGSKAL